MPQQIFFFAKELGLPPKEVLVKARALGIVQAKVPSSWIDDVTLARLKEELLKDHPNLVAKSIAPLGTQPELAAALLGRPKFIVTLSEKEANIFAKLAMFVWLNPDQFIRWPKRAYCFWPGQVRANTDPAIFAFKLAGGDRPQRADWKWEWTIHHIYDGKFEAQPGWQTTHAVRHPAYFTEAAGLVALHPIADSLASEVALFAWLLRHEAFKRFGFDPDGVFNRLP